MFKVLTNSLQRLQNMATHIMCHCGTRAHVTPLRKELHWLPIEARPVFKILCYTYKAINGNLPDYMCDLVSVYNPKRCGLRSGNSIIRRLCTVKAYSAKYGYMCYSLAAPALWNPLPENIRSAETFVTFKKSLKTFPFKNTYVNCIYMPFTVVLLMILLIPVYTGRFFMDFSVMVSLLLLMSLIWNVRILCFM